MIPVQPTLSITIDDTTHQVEDMSPEIQQMVKYLDDWRQHEVDQTSDLLKTRAALTELQNNILKQFQVDTTPVEDDSEPSIIDFEADE